MATVTPMIEAVVQTGGLVMVEGKGMIAVEDVGRPDRKLVLVVVAGRKGAMEVVVVRSRRRRLISGVPVETVETMELLTTRIPVVSMTETPAP